MPENGTDPSRGVQGVVATGWLVPPDDAVAVAVPVVRDAGPTRSTPSSEYPVRLPGATVEIVLAPELLADLHDPNLVITIGYVGPERRRNPRPAPPRVAPTSGRRRAAWMRRIGQVVVMTAAVAVPLTLIADRSVPSGTPVPPPAATTVAPAGAGPTTAHAARGAHVFTATPAQLARAEAAYQRALARAVGGTGTTGAAADLPARAAVAGTAAVVGANAASSTSPQSGSRYRSAARLAEARTRAAARAAAAQRRAQVQAARAAAKAARNSGALPSGVTAPSTGPGPTTASGS